jgi:hypothetical protein
MTNLAIEDGTEYTRKLASGTYYWDGIFRGVDHYVRSWVECQKRRPQRFDEAPHPTFLASVLAKVELDILHMSMATDGVIVWWA